MSVLVTGAAGFIGAACALSLLERGEEVVGVDDLNPYYDPRLKEARLARLTERFGSAFIFLKLDFSDTGALAQGLGTHQFDRIIHLGAQAGVRYSIDNPQAYLRTNLLGHGNMLEIARTRDVSSFVYASSSSVYGSNRSGPFRVDERVDHPVSLYAATKKAGELMSEAYATLYRIPSTGLRFFTVYGPWGRPDMAVWGFTEALFQGRPIRLFNGGDMLRDFTYIDDVVEGVIAALDRPPVDSGAAKPGGSIAPHAIYNLGNSRPEQLGRMIYLLEHATGREAQLINEPMQPGDVPVTAADITESKHDLGFSPKISLDEGIPRFVEWYRRYHSR